MYIHVKVQANAKKESWILRKQDHFEAAVREKAENNRANVSVLRLAAAHFGVATNQVRIVNGHHSPSKLLWVQE